MLYAFNPPFSFFLVPRKLDSMRVASVKRVRQYSILGSILGSPVSGEIPSQSKQR